MKSIKIISLEMVVRRYQASIARWGEAVWKGDQLVTPEVRCKTYFHPSPASVAWLRRAQDAMFERGGHRA